MNWIFFLGKKIFGVDGFQNMFVYQPILNTLELKEDKGTEYALGWKSKGLYTSKLTPLYTTFLQNVKRSGFKTEIQLNKRVLVAKQNSYVTKIVKAYIFYDLDDWPATNIVKKVIKVNGCIVAMK